jgi:hypothetical protein
VNSDKSGNSQSPKCLIFLENTTTSVMVWFMGRYDLWLSWPRTGLTNFWHACPKWHAEKFPWQAAFTAVQFFLYCQTSVSILWRTCVHIHISDGVQTVYELPLLPNINDRGGTVVKVLCTNRKVAASIPAGVIGVFHWHNPSDRTVAPGSTQPLTEIVPGAFPGTKGGRCVRLTTLPPSCAVVM